LVEISLLEKKLEGYFGDYPRFVGIRSPKKEMEKSAID
jgi:hypothetical protein